MKLARLTHWLLISCAACASPSPKTRPPATQDEPAATLSANVEVVPLHTWTSPEAGFFTKTYWLDTGKEVVVFDAQFTPALAHDVLDEIRSKTKSPIRYLVITHPNPDKFNGANVFREAGARIVASRATARAIPTVHAYKKAYFVGAGMFTEDSYPSPPEIDVVFDEQLQLPLDGAASVALRVLEHSGVSSTQTIAHVPEARALIVGDLVHHRAHAWLEGGIVDGKPSPDLKAWRAALSELLAYPGTQVYGGRGATAPVEEAVRAETEYLTRVEQIANAWSEQSRAPDSEAARKELSARVHQAFPDYELGFLTDYSIYGLASSVQP